MKFPWTKTKKIETAEQIPAWINNQEFKNSRLARRKEISDKGLSRHYLMDVWDQIYDPYQEIIEPKVYQIMVLEQSQIQNDKKKLKHAIDSLISSFYKLSEHDKKRTIRLFKKLNISDKLIDYIIESSKGSSIQFSGIDAQIRSRGEN